MSMFLFDLPDDPQPVKLSPDRKRTMRNNAALDAGRHPLMGGDVKTDGSTCGNCIHLVAQGGVAGHFLKCRLRNTGGPATDIRKKWPGCFRHEPAESPDDSD